MTYNLKKFKDLRSASDYGVTHPPPPPKPSDAAKSARPTGRGDDDLAKTIRSLEARVTQLELRTKAPCAQCSDYAVEGDYLCHGCRDVQ